MNATPSPRYHALDSLRAVMMLLGIYLHVACAYGTIPDTWWFQDRRTHPFFDYGLLIIHVFRMPVFYVMSGFFAALLITRRGTLAFLHNRAARIGGPLLAGMILLFPLMMGLQRLSRGWDLSRASAWIFSGAFLRYFHPMHLWFLWYLLMLYALAAFAVVLFRDVDFSPAARLFRRLLPTPWAPAVFALPTFGLLCTMEFGLIATPHRFVPHLDILALYAVFFAFGWALYRSADLLPQLARRAWPLTLAGSLLLGPNLAAVLRQVSHRGVPDPAAFFTAAATGALAVWFLIFGITGLFLRYLDRPRPAMRWLADSAYWMFLIHPLPILVMNMLLAPLSWHPFAKMTVSLAVTSAFLLWTYHAGVRATRLGVFLNGRRYPPASFPVINRFRPVFPKEARQGAVG